MPDKREELSSPRETMPTHSKTTTITLLSINFLPQKHSHSQSITTLTTSLMLVLLEDQVENTVVSHNTGTSNTARVNHKLEHGLISDTRRVSLPNTGSSERISQLRMVLIQSLPEREHQVLSHLTNNLISQPKKNSPPTLLRTELSQRKISEVNGTPSS